MAHNHSKRWIVEDNSWHSDNDKRHKNYDGSIQVLTDVYYVPSFLKKSHLVKSHRI